MDLEPPPGSLRTILPSTICSTRRPLRTSPTLTTRSSTMARAPPGNFMMPFTDTGVIGGAEATAMAGPLPPGAPPDLNGVRGGPHVGSGPAFSAKSGSHPGGGHLALAVDARDRL